MERDELRRAREIIEQIRERIRGAGEEDPLAMRDDVDSLAVLAIDEIAAVQEGAPSLPAGGGDGRFVADETENGDAIVLDTTRDPAPIVAVCPGGSIQAEHIAAALDAPVSSSAGDEARARVREAIEALHLRTDLHDRAIQEAAKAADAALASLPGHNSSADSLRPGADDATSVGSLPGAGDGRGDLYERMVSVLRDTARTRRSDAWGNVSTAAQELLKEIDDAA